jgi:hypothetical protein
MDLSVPAATTFTGRRVCKVHHVPGNLRQVHNSSLRPDGQGPGPTNSRAGTDVRPAAQLAAQGEPAAPSLQSTCPRRFRLPPTQKSPGTIRTRTVRKPASGGGGDGTVSWPYLFSTESAVPSTWQSVTPHRNHFPGECRMADHAMESKLVRIANRAYRPGIAKRLPAIWQQIADSCRIARRAIKAEIVAEFCETPVV